MRTATTGFSEDQRGFGLLAVMMGLAISGIMIAGITKALANSAAHQLSIELKSEADHLGREFGNGAIDCAATLAPFCNPGTPGFCDPGETPVCTDQPLALMRRGGGTIIARTGSKKGRWTVTASCVSTRGVVLRAARPRPGKSVFSTDKRDFFVDPHTQKTLDLSNKRAELAGGAGFCQSMLNPATPSSCPAEHTVATIDFTTGAVTCAPLPDSARAKRCAEGQILMARGGTWECGNLPTVAAAPSYPQPSNPQPTYPAPAPYPNPYPAPYPAPIPSPAAAQAVPLSGNLACFNPPGCTLYTQTLTCPSGTSIESGGNQCFGGNPTYNMKMGNGWKVTCQYASGARPYQTPRMTAQCK